MHLPEFLNSPDDGECKNGNNCFLFHEGGEVAVGLAFPVKFLKYNREHLICVITRSVHTETQWITKKQLL